LEINSETDFVASDETVKKFAQEAVKAAHAANAKTIEEVLAAKTSNGETVEEARQSLIAKIGENIQVRRVKTVEAET
ncbi:elongation factor Ts, partial [Francisella tularensis subsp. holarctica]|nr:elongation factor Ts [Francisella tularensis subsp. holarctica]